MIYPVTICVEKMCVSGYQGLQVDRVHSQQMHPLTGEYVCLMSLVSNHMFAEARTITGSISPYSRAYIKGWTSTCVSIFGFIYNADIVGMT